MARPRQFDEQRALDAAMRAFWSSGYDATSTDALCAATGLGRSSIYNTFTSKHDLFRRALEHYAQERTATLTKLVDADLPARAKLHTLLWQSVDPDPADPLGCFVVNAVVELAQRDPVIAAQLRRDEALRLAALTAIIDAGRRDGEIDAAKDSRTLAWFVMATINGMRVLARGGADRAVLEGIASTALSTI